MEGRARFGSFREPALEAFVALVTPRLREGEEIDDVLSGSVALATHRADLLGRAPLPVDVEFVLTLFCWWPLKPEIPRDAAEQLYRFRRRLFAGAATSAPRRLLGAVSSEVLMLSLDQLQQAQQSEGWLRAWL